MTDIPIIFSAPMIQALLDGRKTMTRRLLYAERKLNSDTVPGNSFSILHGHIPPVSSQINRFYVLTNWHKVKPGDRLWVRERHWRWGCWHKDGKTKTGRQRWRFKASADPRVIPVVFDEPPGPKPDRETLGFHKRPSIFLPREHSRITLIVNATKIDRLQDIPLLDVHAEGLEVRQFWLFGADAKGRQEIGANVFSVLWSDLHGPESWKANPEVVALTFAVHKQNIDTLLAEAA